MRKLLLSLLKPQGTRGWGLLWICLPLGLSAQSGLNSRDSSLIAHCQTTIRTLAPSYSDTTQAGNAYQIYAIHYKKEWIVLVVDSVSFYSYIKAQQVDTLAETSFFYNSNLCKMIEEGHLELNREGEVKEICGIPLQLHYELNRTGKSFYKAMERFEEGKAKLGALAKIGDALAWPFEKLMGLDKIKDLKTQIEEKQALVEKQKKTLEEQKKSLEEVQTQLEAVQEEIAQLKAQDSARKAPSKTDFLPEENQMQDSSYLAKQSNNLPPPSLAITDSTNQETWWMLLSSNLHQKPNLVARVELAKPEEETSVLSSPEVLLTSQPTYSREDSLRWLYQRKDSLRNFTLLLEDQIEQANRKDQKDSLARQKFEANQALEAIYGQIQQLLDDKLSQEVVSENRSGAKSSAQLGSTILESLYHRKDSLLRKREQLEKDLQETSDTNASQVAARAEEKKRLEQEIRQTLLEIKAILEEEKYKLKN